VSVESEIREFLTSRRARVTPERAGLPKYGRQRRVAGLQREEFRVRWATHDVKFHRTGTKQFHHPLVGDLTLAFESLELPADPGLWLLTYSAEPGSASEQALDELARWGATRARLSAVEADAQV